MRFSGRKGSDWDASLQIEHTMVQTLQSGIDLVLLLVLRLRACVGVAIGEAGKFLRVAIFVFGAQRSSARGVAGDSLPRLL